MTALDRGEERRRLAEIASDSWYAEGANGVSVRHCARVFARYWRGSRCLELGPAEGLMTEALVNAFSEVTAVDGSERFCEDLKRRFPDAKVVCSLFEDYEPGRQFDTIVMGHVLEHIDDPASLLARASGWLAPTGVMLTCVPNARSLHRQAAVTMRLLGEEHELNATDRHHGHRRVYDPESLRADVRGAGLQIEAFGGYWLKPISNAQIERDWSEAMLATFMELGERYPDIAGEIYVAATH
jgi:2-polyprenyl-3-methyl-5-hydroxy-6-metoxy-1,4-benzoquinol methylase